MKRVAIIIFAQLLFTISAMGQTGQNQKREIATLGAGCFWCVEAIFERLEGVSRVESGYSGGQVKNPSYKAVCGGETGHAEVVHMEYDPEIISFAKLLEIFFKTHDPTTLNRQGADAGTQYRSVVFYHSKEQEETTRSLITDLDKAGIWNNPIVTTLEAFSEFYSAEQYHQEYFENNPNQGYCRLVIQPKLEKFEKVFSEYLK